MHKHLALLEMKPLQSLMGSHFPPAIYDTSDKAHTYPIVSTMLGKSLALWTKNLFHLILKFLSISSDPGGKLSGENLGPSALQQCHASCCKAAI